MFKNSAIILALLSSAAPVLAQDVLIMRSSIAKPNKTQTGPSEPAPPSSTYAWDAGSFGPWSTTCGPDAIRSRSVTCLKDGDELAEDAMCSGKKPATYEGPMQNLSDCSDKLIDGSFEENRGWTGSGVRATTVPRTGRWGWLLKPTGPNNPISQTIETIPGVTYRMDFWTAKNSNVNLKNYLRAGAYDNADNMLSEVVIPNHAEAQIYEYGSLQWTATSDRTRLSFKLHVSGGSYLAWIDDVSLSAVP